MYMENECKQCYKCNDETALCDRHMIEALTILADKEYNGILLDLDNEYIKIELEIDECPDCLNDIPKLGVGCVIEELSNKNMGD